MSTGTAAQHDRTAIARQSVHDRAGTVVGYELLFRPGPGLAGSPPEIADAAVTDVIRTTFGEFGLDRLGTRRNFYLGVTRSLLTGSQPMPFGPYNVVPELVHPLEVDGAVLDGVRLLKSRGYRLAIDGDLSGPEHPALLPLVDVVKLDLAAAGGQLAELAGYVRAAVPQARPAPPASTTT